MKKFLLPASFILTFLIGGLIGYYWARKKNDSNQTLLQKVTLLPVKKTLNGVDAGTGSEPGTAIKMIKDFRDLVDNQNATFNYSVSAVYDISELKEIYNLLDKEKPRVKGVRFYFGIDNSPSVDPKHKIKIFMVSTELRYTVNGSPYGDYYDHDNSLLNWPEIAIANDNDAMNQVTQGATLYDPSFTTTENCTNRSSHYIDFPTAQSWAHSRCELTRGQNDSQPINTSSEWFPICFIQNLFKSIINSNKNLDGLRIYLAKGYPDTELQDPGQLRDVFMLVPTQKQTQNGKTKPHVDFYQCLEGIGADLDCVDPQVTGAYNPKNALLAQKRNLTVNNLIKYGYFYAGYDKGELCPYNCN